MAVLIHSIGSSNSPQRAGNISNLVMLFFAVILFILHAAFGLQMKFNFRPGIWRKEKVLSDITSCLQKTPVQMK